MSPANKKTFSLTFQGLQDFSPFQSPYSSTISPNAGFCREIGKTQPENLRFRHDSCWYGFNRQKGKALKTGVFGLKLGTPMVIKVSYETIPPAFPPLFLQSSWTLGGISPARYNQCPWTRYKKKQWCQLQQIFSMDGG